MNYIVHYDICAFLIASITMAFFFLSPRLQNRQSSLFAMIGSVIVASCLFNIFATLLDGNGSPALIYLLNLLYLTSIHALPCAMLFYLFLMTGRLKLQNPLMIVLIIIPYALEFLLICTSPLTHLIYYVSDLYYHQGSFFLILYGGAVFYILFTLLLIILFRDRLAGRRAVASTAFINLQLIAVIIQYSNPEYQLVDLAAALSLLIMYIALHSSADISDPLTRAYNFAAISRITAERFRERRPFLMLSYSIDNFRHINEVYGEDCGDDLLLSAARMLNETFHGLVARTYDNRFIVILKGDTPPGKVEQLAKQIPDTWHNRGYEIPLYSSAIILDSRYFPSAGEMQETLEFILRTDRSSAERRTILVDSAVITRFHRAEQVRTAVEYAIEHDSVQVVYQPIFHASNDKIAAAEALARITDPTLGPISPSEFIPIAEQCGLMTALGKCIRARILDLLSHFDIRKAGIEHISINLSAIECSQKGVIDSILAETKEARLEPGLVCFEVTETAASNSVEILSDNLNALHTAGNLLYLDDYGTGYSNMINLLSLPFDLIKIDKSIVNLAASPRNNELVKCVISPFHKCGVQIVCEGVETEQQAAMVRLWGADYIQGFLFAHPLSQDAFLKFAGIERRTTA